MSLELHRAMEWLQGWDTGSSSKGIMSMMLAGVRDVDAGPMMLRRENEAMPNAEEPEIPIDPESGRMIDIFTGEVLLTREEMDLLAAEARQWKKENYPPIGSIWCESDAEGSSGVEWTVARYSEDGRIVITSPGSKRKLAYERFNGEPGGYRLVQTARE